MKVFGWIFFVVTWKTLPRLLTDEFEGISNGKSSSIVANKTKWGNISTKMKVNESMESWISHKKAKSAYITNELSIFSLAKIQRRYGGS